MTDVAVTAAAGIHPEQVEAARQHVASSLGDAGASITGARLTLRRGSDPAAPRPYVADAIAFHHGRVLAAHATGATAVEAAEAVARRLHDQLSRIVREAG